MVETLREKQKEEAKKRMKKWRLMENVRIDFDANVLNCSERVILNVTHKTAGSRSTAIAKINWLTDEEKQIVKDFEAEYEGLVYHLTKIRTTEGVLYTLLYVSSTEEEWKADLEDIEHSSQVCYTYPEFYPIDAEIGWCTFSNRYGGLLNK